MLSSSSLAVIATATASLAAATQTQEEVSDEPQDVKNDANQEEEYDESVAENKEKDAFCREMTTTPRAWHYRPPACDLAHRQNPHYFPGLAGSQTDTNAAAANNGNDGETITTEEEEEGKSSSEEGAPGVAWEATPLFPPLPFCCNANYTTVLPKGTDVLLKDEEARWQYDALDHLLQRYDCSTFYPLQSCDPCRDAYRTWLCATTFPMQCYGKDEVMLRDESDAYAYTHFDPSTDEKVMMMQNDTNSNTATKDNNNNTTTATTPPPRREPYSPTTTSVPRHVLGICEDVCLEVQRKCPSIINFHCPTQMSSNDNDGDGVYKRWQPTGIEEEDRRRSSTSSFFSSQSATGARQKDREAEVLRSAAAGDSSTDANGGAGGGDGSVWLYGQGGCNPLHYNLGPGSKRTSN